MLHAQVVPSLMKWGVSPQADLVYRTLLTFGPWSVDSISRSLDMRARQVRSALDELTALGAAVPDRAPADGGGDDRVWSGRAPAHVVSLLRDRHQRTAQARHRLHRRLSRTASPHLLTDPLRLSASGARSLGDRTQAQGRIGELMAAERHEHLAINPESAYDAATIKAAAPRNRGVLTRGVTALSLGVPASADDESDWHDEEMLSHGLQYRELPEVPGKLIVVDRTTALVRQDPRDRSRGMWEVTAPELVAELTALFFSYWDLAKDPGRQWTPPAGLSPRESTIVVLLAKGHTDGGIASKLDISVRTIAYTMSGLMDRYDVTNRFQLGLRLGAEAARQAAGEHVRNESDGEQNQ
ncbi:helix-turn-helix transcriptional regulator [Catellatospora sp. NPDC049609]|uniref:helix-turn-helix transcriptional regulator n=1 Tax=Catellatospora sp. NPDC049609 TaxID=3155505 RepID=UPI003419EE11